MKTKYVAILTICLIAIYMLFRINNIEPYDSIDQVSEHTGTQSIQNTNNQHNNFLGPDNSQINSLWSRQEESSQSGDSNKSGGENEQIAINSSEKIRITAIRNLEDTPEARKILIDALHDESPHTRIASLERLIEIEDPSNRAFNAAVDAVLINEKNPHVIEAALSYYSMTGDEATYEVVQNILERSDLSGDILSYAGEILYDDYKMDKDSIKKIISESPSFNALDQTQLALFNEKISEAFGESDKNDENDDGLEN